MCKTRKRDGGSARDHEETKGYGERNKIFNATRVESLRDYAQNAPSHDQAPERWQSGRMHWS